MSSVFLAPLCALLANFPLPADGDPPIQLAGLIGPARVVRDDRGIAHISAQNEHDLFILTGWIQAEDRLWQMDVNRRLARGTLAELVGPDALETDVFFRSLGLGRAADASLETISGQARAACESFAIGVNAYLASHPLPIEYSALELTQLPPWEASDCLAVGKILTFGLSFGLDIDRTVALLSYVQAGAQLNFDGQALYFEDLWRAQDFVAPPTVPNGGVAPDCSQPRVFDASAVDVKLLEQAKRRLDGDPLLSRLLAAKRARGSNAWVVAGSDTVTGTAMLASDPHLDLGAPSTLYPIHLKTSAYTVAGEGFAGVPYVILGHNNFLSWGMTVNSVDCTDVFQEQVVPDVNSPSGLSTLYAGVLEPIVPIPIQFRANIVGDGIPDNVEIVDDPNLPSYVLFVPRRNGPIIDFDPLSGAALSVQYTGTYATREIDCFRALGKARDLASFQAGLKYFDTGSQNFLYADVAGNIAYFAAGEVPVREDLQSMVVNGLPPCFVRSGQGGNEWLAIQAPQPGQATPHEVLPFEEMPQAVNPAQGWLCNANNDPLGLTHDNDPLNTLRPAGGILYLDWNYTAASRQMRATERIEQELAGGMKISLDDFRDIQADTLVKNGERFVPFLGQAYANALLPGADPMLAALAADVRVQQAMARLANWGFTTPTGILEGYDASDVHGGLLAPSNAEIDESVGATLFAVWFGQLLPSTIDAPLAAFGLPLAVNGNEDACLYRMLVDFDVNLGVGASGIDFFAVSGIADPHARRDFLLLDSLRKALDLMSGPAFDSAFHSSTNLSDYRWGRLHRIVFRHFLDDALLNVPSAGGAWPPPLAGLDGIPVDGGIETIDVAGHDFRADSADEFMFSAGPSRRCTVRMAAIPRAQSSLPGGASGNVFSPSYTNLLPDWLTNEAYAVLWSAAEISAHTAQVLVFIP